MSELDESRRYDALDRAQTALRVASHFSSSIPEPVFVGLDTIPRVRPTYLWPRRIPNKGLTFLCGLPGKGKSLVTLDLAARVSTGAAFPGDTETREPRNVLIMSAEDDSESVRWRFDEFSGDLKHVKVMNVNSDIDLTQLSLLEDQLKQYNPALLVVDPVTAFYGEKTETHVMSSIRRVLKPIAKLTEKYSLSTLLVTHPSKAGNIAVAYSPSGSGGQGAAARSILIVTVDPEDPHVMLLSHAKASRSKNQPTLRYIMTQVDNDEDRVKLAWLGTDGRSAHELYDLENDRDRKKQRVGPKKRSMATDLVLGELDVGQKSFKELKKFGSREGISASTVRRAIDELHEDGKIRGYWHGREYRYVAEKPKPEQSPYEPLDLSFPPPDSATYSKSGGQIE